MLRAAGTALPGGRSARQNGVLFMTGLLPGAKLTPVGHEDATCLDFKCLHCMPHVGPVGCLGRPLLLDSFAGVEEAWCGLKLRGHFELDFSN